MIDKASKILALNGRLRHPNELAGLFLPKGYRERFDIMFLGEMPSMNGPKNVNLHDNYNFGVTARDRFFQEMLIKYNVTGSYCTDIVKKRDVPRKPTREEVQEWLPFLLEEIKIIDPKVILVIGKRTYDVSFTPYISSKLNPTIMYDYIYHYCSQVSRSKFEERLSQVLIKSQDLIRHVRS